LKRIKNKKAFVFTEGFFIFCFDYLLHVLHGVGHGLGLAHGVGHGLEQGVWHGLGQGSTHGSHRPLTQSPADWNQEFGHAGHVTHGHGFVHDDVAQYGQQAIPQQRIQLASAWAKVSGHSGHVTHVFGHGVGHGGCFAHTLQFGLPHPLLEYDSAANAGTANITATATAKTTIANLFISASFYL